MVVELREEIESELVRARADLVESKQYETRRREYDSSHDCCAEIHEVKGYIDALKWVQERLYASTKGD